MFFSMCNGKRKYDYRGDWYRHHEEILTSYCTRHSISLLESADDDMALVRTWSQRWQKFQQTRRFMYSIFSYLDKFYVVDKGEIPLEQQAG